MKKMMKSCIFLLLLGIALAVQGKQQTLRRANPPSPAPSAALLAKKAGVTPGALTGGMNAAAIEKSYQAAIDAGKAKGTVDLDKLNTIATAAKDFAEAVAENQASAGSSATFAANQAGIPTDAANLFLAAKPAIKMSILSLCQGKFDSVAAAAFKDAYGQTMMAVAAQATAGKIQINSRFKFALTEAAMQTNQDRAAYTDVAGQCIYAGGERRGDWNDDKSTEQPKSIVGCTAKCAGANAFFPDVALRSTYTHWRSVTWNMGQAIKQQKFTKDCFKQILPALHLYMVNFQYTMEMSQAAKFCVAKTLAPDYGLVAGLVLAPLFQMIVEATEAPKPAAGSWDKWWQEELAGPDKSKCAGPDMQVAIQALHKSAQLHDALEGK